MFEFKLENENGEIVNINDGQRYLIVPPISGLNPPTASIFTAKSPNRKGLKYNGSTLDERYIGLTIKLLGDVEANRNELYKWVDSEQYCKVLYKNGVKNVYCEGYIEECEIDLFTDNEVVSVSILCADPFWKDLQEISTELASILYEFVFPFAIDANGVPFSTINGIKEATIFNAGVETGMRIVIRCTGEVKNLSIFDTNDISKSFKINKVLNANEIIVIDTDGSPKTVVLTKEDGTTQSLLKNVSPNPTWFTLKKGNNFFSYTADVGVEEVAITFEYTNKYLGV
jgi:hypothetical protein